MATQYRKLVSRTVVPTTGVITTKTVLAVVQQRTDEIKTLVRRSAQDIIEIGHKLTDVKDRLGHGNFGAWLGREFDWSERTARQMMQVAETFKTANFADLGMAPSALYLLASPSTPEDARQEAIERAQAGERITYTTATTIVEAHKSEEDATVIEAETSSVTSPSLFTDDDDPATEPEYVEATPPQPDPLETTQAAKPADRTYILLDEWHAMTLDEKASAMEARGTTGLNKQDNDSIEWAKWSWNPVTGCRHNCSYCYARDIAAHYFKQGFEPTFLPSRLSMPRNTRVPTGAAQDIGLRNVFTCSMADLFGRWVPREWIEAVLQAISDAPQWNFLFLTKFPIRLSEFEFPANAWLGTTVDAQARVANAERAMSKVKGGIKWLSCEPLLEPLRFSSLEMFDWVVIGGASKSTQTPEFRPPRPWVEDLEAQARRAGCRVYEKSNLLERIKEYPGQTDAQPVNVPDEFKMTYLQRDVLTPTDYQREFTL